MYLGGPIRYIPKSVTRTQDGKLGIGANLPQRNLRLKAARQGRHQLLVRTGARPEEQRDLWWKLRGDTEPAPGQRRALEHYLAGVRRQRKRDWAEWKNTQHKRYKGE